MQSHDSADSAGVDMPTAVASTPPLTPVASPVPDKSFLTPESPGFAIIGLGSPSGSLTPDKVFLMRTQADSRTPPFRPTCSV